MQPKIFKTLAQPSYIYISGIGSIAQYGRIRIKKKNPMRARGKTGENFQLFVQHVCYLPMFLKMFSDGHSFLNQVVEILRQIWCQSCK